MTYNTFAKSTFNAEIDHNARFAKKNLQLNINTIDALLSYFENGGAITVCKAGRRSRANTSFPKVVGSVAHKGAKSNSLKNAGFAKGRG